ncbi:MAG TPA: helix-turn-helix domain-containing protein [Bacteroidota bacterium]|nr:helix-turn-helix domain-containing protein [Bacteroidota bacterium]
MKGSNASGGAVCYSSRDLARLFSVDESTIRRWADSGKLKCSRTLGHHRRFSIALVSEFASTYHLDVNLPESSHSEESEG